MSSENPADPRSDSQVEAETANAEEQVREVTFPEGNRDADVASAQEYAKGGIMGAPGSEAAAGAGFVVKTDDATAAGGKGAAKKDK